MSKNSVKKATITAALICAAIAPGISSAHDTTGVLGAAISNIDVYHTSCFTWTAAGAAAFGGSALPAKRFAARVAKQCATNNAACGGQAGTLRVSIGGKDSTPNDSATLIGASATTTATGGGAIHGEAGTTWTATPSAWAQTANNGPATDKSGDYLVAVSHESAVAHKYWVQFHCEDVAVGALPVPSDLNNNRHTGTGVTATGATIVGPYDGSPVGTVPGDWNMVINQ